MIGIDYFLEGVQNRIETDPFLNGMPRIFFEFIEEGRLWKVMEGIHDFISKPNEAIDRVDRCPDGRVKGLDAG